MIENYVEPNYENEAQLSDPTLLSVVSVFVIHLFPPILETFLSLYHTSYLSDETFFGCNCLRATVRERKTHVDNSVAFLLIYLSILFSYLPRLVEADE